VEQSPLLKTFSESLCKFSIRPANQGDILLRGKHPPRIVVAVSGGADSVCLLHLFLQAGFLSSLHVAHLNHGFREESDQEAVFVSELCQSWGVPCALAKRNVLETCKKMRLSKQEGARAVRYAFLQDVAKTQGASVIALGHTADDQAETILINTLRGAGMRGFMGIPMSRNAQDCMLIRPMLFITRNDIIAELRSARIPFVEDPSNYDMKYLRNRVRHKLIPHLSEYNPRIKETLLRGAVLLSDEDRFIEIQLENLLPTLTPVIDDTVVSFDLALFLSLHICLKRRLLRWGIVRLRGSCRSIGFEHIETVLTKITGIENGKRLGLPDRMTLRKTKTRLILEWVDVHNIDNISC